MRDAGQEGCRKGGMQDRRLKRDKGQEQYMQDRRDAGQEGCRTGGVYNRRGEGQEGCRTEVM